MSKLIPINAIGNSLKGTCNSLYETLSSFDLNDDDLEQKHYEALDEITLCCHECGWWVDPSEIGEEFCKDCEDKD
jgi:hypothetical protein